MIAYKTDNYLHFPHKIKLPILCAEKKSVNEIKYLMKLLLSKLVFLFFPTLLFVSEIKGQQNKVYEIRGMSDKFNKQDSAYILRERVQNIARKYPEKLIINGNTKRLEVALTFDDAPDPYFTPKILDCLKNYDLRATFFCIGEQIVKYPEILKRIYEEGHTVANHSFTHPKFTKIRTERLLSELNKTDSIIHSIIGKRTRFVRPPYGRINDTICNNINENGQIVIYWSLDTFDWLENPDKMLSIVEQNIRKGDIILMHSNKKQTVKVLDYIISALVVRGYNFVSIDEMIKKTAYKKEVISDEQEQTYEN